MARDPDLPAHDEYADAEDTNDWTVARDGRMADYATADDDVETEPA